MEASTTPSSATDQPAVSQPSLVRSLSLLDSVLLLAGGIIGSSIFLTAKDIAGPLPHPLLFLLVWVLGGAISLCACVAFAELGSMFPDSGGQYVYLREAYGDLPAFLYGWMLFSVANGGTIAALSVASAAYLGGIVPFHFAGARGLLGCRDRSYSRSCSRPDFHRRSYLDQRGRTAMGHDIAEPGDLGEIRGHGRVRNSGIRNRQRRLASLHGGSRTKPDPGIELQDNSFPRSAWL